MGSQPLEARLRWRVLAVLAPVLSGVGFAAIFVASHMLATVDEDRARAMVDGASRTYAGELAEGEPPDRAAHETAFSFDPAEERLQIGATAMDGMPSSSAIEGLASRACTALVAADGSHWTACAGMSGTTRLVAAIRTDAHAAVVRHLTQWMFGVVLLAALAVALMTRAALTSPLRALRRLTAWADQPLDLQAPLPVLESGAAEIELLAARFAGLTTQLREALERERACTAHIAHELRTPLATILAELDAHPSDVRHACAPTPSTCPASSTPF